MADRYTGRHIRQARHGAWVNKKRSRAKPSRHLLPAAAALTVAGFLIGGAGASMQLSLAGQGADLATDYDPADYPPPDRDAQLNRASRDDARSAGAATDATVAAQQPAPEAATAPDAAHLGSAGVIASGSCEASYNDQPQLTANGETFDPAALTAAHKSLPFNSRVRVTNPANGESVIVRINDRGPFVGDRCLDLSRAAFDSIAALGLGVVDVRYEVLAQDAT